MPQVAYPKALNKDHWDKKKGIIAKTKPTGIGKMLKELEKDHNAIIWDNFKPTWADGLKAMPQLIDGELQKRLTVCTTKMATLAVDAKAVAALATTWQGKFEKDKLIPAGAAKAAKEVADAAKAYAKALEDVDDEVKKEAAAAKKSGLENIRQALGPILKGNLAKVNTFISDIEAFTGKPEKATFDKLALGDGGARGYATACQNWDKSLAAFAWLRDPIFNGKAMDTFFPLVSEYGANRSNWDTVMKDYADKNAKGDLAKAYKHHAGILKSGLADVKTFKGYIQAAIDALA